MFIINEDNKIGLTCRKDVHNNGMERNELNYIFREIKSIIASARQQIVDKEDQKKIDNVLNRIEEFEKEEHIKLYDRK